MLSRCRMSRYPPGNHAFPAPGSLLLVLVQPCCDCAVLPPEVRPSAFTTPSGAPQAALSTSQLAIPPMEEAAQVEEQEEFSETRPASPRDEGGRTADLSQSCTAFAVNGRSTLSVLPTDLFCRVHTQAIWIMVPFQVSNGSVCGKKLPSWSHAF